MYKNTITLIVDSTQNPPITIVKPEEIKAPENAKEAVEMINSDFKTLCLGIIELANMGQDNGLFTAIDAVNSCVTALQESLKEENQDEEE